MKRFSGSNLLWRILLGAGLVAGCVFIYHRLPGFEFVAFDDDISFTLNPKLGPLSIERIGELFALGNTILRYVPLGWVLFSLLFWVGGLDPMWYHTAGFVVHVLNSLLVALLAARVMELGGLAGTNDTERRWTAFAAAVGGAFWALHPLRVETTSWCTGLFYLFGCFWMLLSALAYCAALKRYASEGRWGPALPVSVGLFLMSLLSYPLAIGYPVAVAALTFWRLYPEKGDKTHLVRHSFIRASVGVMAMAVLSSAAVLIAVYGRARGGGLWNAPTGLAEFGLMQRAGQGAYVLVNSLVKTVMPSNLSPVYGDLEKVNPLELRIAGCLIACLLFALLIWFQRRRLGYVLIVFVYVGLILPFCGFLEHPFFPCDRYTLIPGVVLGVALACQLSRVRAESWRLVAAVMTLSILATLALASKRQTESWRNSNDLFSRIITGLKSDSLRAGYMTRWVVVKANEGHLKEARKLLLETQAAYPGAPSLASTIQELARVEKLTVLVDPEQRVSPVALEVDRLALEALRQGQMQESLARFEYALRVAPFFHQARFNYAVALARGGMPDRALAQYFWLRGVAGNQPEQCKGLMKIIGLSYGATGQERLAAFCFREVERLERASGSSVPRE